MLVGGDRPIPGSRLTHTRLCLLRFTRAACLAIAVTLAVVGHHSFNLTQAQQPPPPSQALPEEAPPVDAPPVQQVPPVPQLPPAQAPPTQPSPVPPLPAPTPPEEPGAAGQKRTGDIELSAESVLQHTLLVTWYGNPHSKRMGILGEFTGDELANGLRHQAEAYAALTDKPVQPAYELVAIVAQNNPGRDGMWRRRESRAIIERMLAEARGHGFKLVLDVQVGHSTVEAELEYLRRYLEEPDVYLALDPEFDMPNGEAPGTRIGTTPARDVNYAVDLLERIVIEKKLPPKVLIVHQFTMNMLPDKRNVQDSPVVDVALVMDGWGPRQLKHAIYRMVTRTPLEYAGIKLFYRKEPDLLSPSDVLELKPTPSIVIYQ